MKETLNLLMKVGYMYKNPHQLGILMYLYILVKMFGANAYIVAQVLNVIAVLIAFFCIYKIVSIIFKNKEISEYTVIGNLAFIPISMYITFIYGNLTGFACSMLAVMFEIMYIDTQKKRYIAPMVISICFAVLFKSNYLITMIAMVILLLMESVFEKKIKLLIPVCIIIISYLLSGQVANWTGKLITGKDINKGTPMKSYIAMGLQEGDKEAGWYNGYTQKIYKKQKYDYEKTSNKINKDIEKSLNKLKQDPKYAFNFFGRKIVSEWNNPTFQSFWINYKRKSDIQENRIVKSIMNPKKRGNIILRDYMNIIQTLILFGTVMYLVLGYKKIKLRELIFAIIFIGGFLFHIVWEAKCQYTVTYFVLLIPYSVIGYRKVCENLVNFYNNRIKKLKYIETKDIMNETKE